MSVAFSAMRAAVSDDVVLDASDPASSSSSLSWSQSILARNLEVLAAAFEHEAKP